MRNLIKQIIREVSEENPKSNLNRLLEKFKMNFPDELKPKIVKCPHCFKTFDSREHEQE